MKIVTDLHHHSRTIFLFCFLVLLASCGQESNDKILYNGTIYTLNDALPEVEAVAISNDKIVAVGELEFVKTKVSRNATLIDLNNKFLIPGLIDSHNHAIKGGERLLTADLGDKILSANELVAFARDALQTGKGQRGDALYITGVHSAMWSNIHLLDSIFNSDVYETIPVLLYGMDSHTGWINTTMLKRAGIDKTFINTLPKNELKFYGVNADGEPNGFLSERVLEKVNDSLPEGTITKSYATLSGIKHLNSLGITAWLDPSVGNVTDGDKNVMLAAYKKAAEDNMLTAHVATTIIADPNGDVIPQINLIKNFQREFKSVANVTVLGFKIFADGVMEYPTQTASLSKPYINSGLFGSLMFDPEKFKTFVTAADQNGLLVHIHAIGDRTVIESLNAFETARNVNGNDSLAHSITHLQIVLPNDMQRFAKLNVLASMQLLWATADHYTEELVKPYIDSLLYMYHYPAKSLINAGATLCGASDWPVTSANPFEAISTAETRTGELGVLNEHERVFRMEMIKAYTIHAAKALWMEKMIGSIEPGKQADFVLVDRDVMTVDSDAIADTKVIWTMFGGDIIYEAK